MKRGIEGGPEGAGQENNQSLEEGIGCRHGDLIKYFERIAYSESRLDIYFAGIEKS